MERTRLKRVAIQGGYGAFHEIAAREYFEGEEIEVVPCDTFPALFATLKREEAEYGIMAIENSVAGSLLPNYTLLRDSGMEIIGEIFLRIQQNLLALPGQTINDIQEVHSHPIAIMQTQVFFDQYPDIKLIETVDTALSAKKIQDKQLKGVGAIASKLAGILYGLTAISEGIETNKKNFTRFLMLADKKHNHLNRVENHNVTKASIYFSLPHKKGSLSNVLSVLAFYDMNLTKIQSLPIVGEEWQYLFYVDLTFEDYLRYSQSIIAIKPLTTQLEILGEYTFGKNKFENSNGQHLKYLRNLVEKK